MGYQKRSNLHTGKFFSLVVSQWLQRNIAIGYQLAPRAIAAQIVCHSGHGKYRHIVGAHRLMAKKHQACIMANMGMSEEYPGKCIALSLLFKLVELSRHMWRGLKQICFASPGVDQGHRRCAPLQPRISPSGQTVLLITAGLWVTCILSHTQHI